MSRSARRWVLEHSKARGGERLVLFAIAYLADDDWIAWPTVDQISQLASISHATVFRSLKSLTARGELEVFSGHGVGRRNTYRVLGDPLLIEEVDR